MNLTYDWLRHYPIETQALDEIPLLGLTDFPWHKLSEVLTQTFSIADFEITPHVVTWKTKDDLLTELSHPLSGIHFMIPNLKGEACWMMSTEELELLESLLLTNDTNPLTLHDPDFKHTFQRFLILETLYAISRVNPDPSLTPILTNETELKIEDSLCLDISIRCNNRNMTGRLIISQLLRQSLSNYSQKKQARSPHKIAQNVKVPVHIQVGHTKLKWSDWKKVSLGDFISLDRCSLEPDTLKGPVTLSIFGQPAFYGELSNAKIKIIEFPLFQEEDTHMIKDITNREDDEDDEDDELSDLNLDDDDDWDDDEDDDDDFDELDEDLFKDFDEEKSDENELNEDAEFQSSKNTPSATTSTNENVEDERVSAEKTLEKIDEIPSQGLLKSEHVPISLIVELGELNISMDKLLQIEVGNLLDISIPPENGVNLTFNGKLIAKAELIRIGENLGVRILELA